MPDNAAYDDQEKHGGDRKTPHQYFMFALALGFHSPVQQPDMARPILWESGAIVGRCPLVGRW